ncbi:MAG: YggS family pyridoxal phosphate-dependent enzyme [Endomicrobiales bacterium]|nr:YggS family pyridoxal phosphate-dependent enzyme [Endomicrobiales bacterium]
MVQFIAKLKMLIDNFKPELCNRFENRGERDGDSFDAKTADNGDSIGKGFAEKNVPYLLTNSESYCKIRVEAINDRILQACNISGKDPKEITLVAVTKKVSLEQIFQVISFGVSDIAENKIQEAQTKIPEISVRYGLVKKHFIGHLQTNKAKKAVELFDLIQSIDSIRIAQSIDRAALEAGKIQECLVELKVSGEESKFGVKPEELNELVEYILSCKNIKLRGLMAMAPYFDEVENSRKYFREAKEVFENIKTTYKLADFNVLSMGMSADFEVAIEEGATLIRVGSGLFGEINGKQIK